MAVSRSRVLVVDDEPAVADLVTELVNRSGFEGRPATTPDETLAQGCVYHVAVVDLAMPGMSGLDLAERVRERSPEYRS